jgi:cytochrome c oxidase subunit IV
MKEQTASPRMYFAIFAALAALTLVTTGVAYIDLGIFNPVVALTIAVVKATLVVLFFMHVWFRGKLTWVFIGAGVLWLAFLIVFTLSDAVTRPWIPVPTPWTGRSFYPGGPNSGGAAR